MSFGTGVYRRSLEVTAKIAVTKKRKSKFESTTMCAADEMINFRHHVALKESSL